LSPQRRGLYPEIDCVRDLLPRHVVAAAESRARSIGLGADSVLICTDAITEEAYLSALAASLGTSYERFEGVSRADCPLDDNELIQAVAAGLLPLREGQGIVWIIAPRCLTARRLANQRQPWPSLLRPFRLTSPERLGRFAVRHARKALGRRAAFGLRQTRPGLSNAPRPRGWRMIVAIALLMLVLAILVLVPAATLEAFGTVLCTVFLAAAALRLSSACYTLRIPERRDWIADDQLPIYTIICALYREAAVVPNLVAAIRALDYPGIMAQTPQAV
jgi:hypothetical protein